MEAGKIDETVTIMMTSPGGASTQAVEIPRRIGNVKLGEQLGRGADGVVLAGFDDVLNRKVTVKLLRRSATTAGRGDLRHFVEGVRSAAAVKHPNILTVYQVDIIAGMPVLVMEYVDGISLRDLLRRSGSLEPPLSLYMVRTIAAGIEALHEARIVHHDLKPANVLFDRDGHAHVCDFGLARRLSAASRVQGEQSISGTPLYMAPEMFTGTVSPQSDVYALGVMLFEMLDGRPPFSAVNMDEMRARHSDDPVPVERLMQRSVGEELCDVVRRAMQKTRILRYKTAGHFLRALQSLSPAGAADTTHAQRIAEIVNADAAGDSSAPRPPMPQSVDHTTFDLVARRARAKRSSQND